MKVQVRDILFFLLVKWFYAIYDVIRILQEWWIIDELILTT